MKSGSLPEKAFLSARACGTVALSRQAVTEYREVLNRPKFERIAGSGRVGEMLDLLVVGAVWVTPSECVTDCRDTKDNIYLELALEAQASCIISGDMDLLVLHPWRGINIVSPGDFLDTYSLDARLNARVEAAVQKLYGNQNVDEERLGFIRRSFRLIFTDTLDDGEEGRVVESWPTPDPNR